MTNHYHVVIETPEANLAQGMRQLNGVYTRYFKRSHRKVGHVFQGRYKAILVERMLTYWSWLVMSYSTPSVPAWYPMQRIGHGALTARN